MAELDDEWEMIDSGEVANGMVVVTTEADTLELTYEEAQLWLHWPKWKEAIQVELHNLKAAGTCEVVETMWTTPP